MKSFIILFSVLFFSLCVIAQTPYYSVATFNLPLFSTFINSMDVEGTDVDGDGDVDLIIASEYGRNLLLINDGNAHFVEDSLRLFPKKDPLSPQEGEDSEDVAIGDFNNDGFQDVFFVSEDTDFHELLINDGNGNFSFIPFDFPASTANAVALLDLNDDDYLDIIIGNTGQNDIYINNQDLTFTQSNDRWPNNSEGTQDLKLIDLDGDNDFDIVEGIDIGTNNILINNNGFFHEENERLPNTGLNLETRKISIGDANNDGFEDLFICTVNFIGNMDLQNRLYLSDGNGFFTDATASTIPNYQEHTLDAVFVDIDLDEDLDLVTVDFQNSFVQNYHAFENVDGLFVENTTEVFEEFSLSTGVAIYCNDLNGDSFKDIYFGNFQETDDLLLYSQISSTHTELIDDYSDYFKIYPNPASDVIIIEHIEELVEVKNVYFNIYDSLGHQCYSYSDLFNSMNQEIIVLEISHLPVGTYVAVIDDLNQTYLKTKFIVSH